MLRGFVGPAGSLWYFPLMNLVLFGIAIFLVTQRRTIVFDSSAKSVRALPPESLPQDQTHRVVRRD